MGNVIPLKLAPIEKRTGLQSRQASFAKGEVLIQEGFVSEAEGAFLVLEGKLLEQMTFFDPDKGHVTMTVFQVGPGGVAFFQGLSEEQSKRASITTIVADSDGTMLFINREWLERLGEVGRLLEAEISSRRQLLQSLEKIRLAGKFETTILEVVERTTAENPNRDWTVKDIRRTIISAMVDRKQLENEAQAERRVAQDARAMMLDGVNELEKERFRMTRMALAWEIFYDRIRQKLVAGGIPANVLDLTEEETLLFMGETPENFEEIANQARAKRRLEFADLASDDPEITTEIDDTGDRASFEMSELESLFAETMAELVLKP